MDDRKFCIENIERNIRQLEKMKERLEYVPIERFIERFPSISFRVDSHFKEMNFSCPMSFALIDEIEKFVKKEFSSWKKYSDRQYIWETSDSAGRFISYAFDSEKGEILVEFEFRSTTEGSTCVLNKIGEEVKTVPIYEVVCSQAAADELSV